ncbi:hypothetical protein [Streptomyces tendae]|uniref:hypothetical protein n=1 Tax=Streptomyces tendae TaxID=1932 RepID=UPI00248FC00B|nr:hypothetical protein [Streptomyces tendae]
MRSEDILAQINDTLDDWAVSDDAMRSRPGGETGGVKGFTPQFAIMDEVAAPRFWIAPVGTPVEADGWEEVGYITDADFVIAPAAVATPQPTVTWDEIACFIAQIEEGRARRARLLEAFVQAFTESIETVRPRIEEAFQAIADCVQAVEHAAPPPPGRRRDRPAWQSPYGPPRRRR